MFSKVCFSFRTHSFGLVGMLEGASLRPPRPRPIRALPVGRATDVRPKAAQSMPNEWSERSERMSSEGLAAAFDLVPAAGVPVPAIFGRAARHDDLVAFTGTDLVVAAGAAIGADRFVRLHMANVNAVVG